MFCRLKSWINYRGSMIKRPEAPKIAASEAAAGGERMTTYCTAEQSRTTQERDVSSLTVGNARSLSAQNRNHLPNNPRHIQLFFFCVCKPDRQGWIRAKCTLRSLHAPTLRGCGPRSCRRYRKEALRVMVIRCDTAAVSELTITRGARPTKSL